MVKCRTPARYSEFLKIMKYWWSKYSVCVCVCGHIMSVWQSLRNKDVWGSKQTQHSTSNNDDTPETQKHSRNSSASTVPCYLREVLSAKDRCFPTCWKKWSTRGNPDAHNRWYIQYEAFVVSWQQLWWVQCQHSVILKLGCYRMQYNITGETDWPADGFEVCKMKWKSLVFPKI